MYLLDTNVFISAYKFHYSFDFHPGFWDWLTQANKYGHVFSIPEVHEEISRYKDPLSEWADDHKNTLFFALSPDIDLPLKQVADYLYKNYKSADIQDFLDTADHFLIAYALKNFTAK